MSESYDCAICEHRVDMTYAQYWRGPNRLRPPLCRMCERDYGRPATHGAFADRRAVAVGSALAESLACEATRATWPEAWR